MNKKIMNALMAVGYVIGMTICAASGYFYVKLWKWLNT